MIRRDRSSSTSSAAVTMPSTGISDLEASDAHRPARAHTCASLEQVERTSYPAQSKRWRCKALEYSGATGLVRRGAAQNRPATCIDHGCRPENSHVKSCSESQARTSCGRSDRKLQRPRDQHELTLLVVMRVDVRPAHATPAATRSKARMSCRTGTRRCAPVAARVFRAPSRQQRGRKVREMISV